MKRKIYLKKFTGILTVAAMGLTLFAGCGSTGEAKSSEESTAKEESAVGEETGSQELIPVTIYGVTDPQEAAQLIIAKDKGYFEEEGLDVTNVLIESSADLPAYIASGEAPISAESQYTCTEVAAQGVKLKTLMTNSKTSNT